MTVLATVAALTSTYLLRGYPYGPVFLPLVVAVYTVARHVPLRRALPVAAAVLPLLLAHVLVHPAALPGWVAVLPGSAWVAVPFAVGTAMRTAREAEARSRAEMLRAGVLDERELRPDVVLMDIRMPGVDGLEATRRIVGDPSLAATRVIVLTTFELDDYVFEACGSERAGSCSRTPDPRSCWPASGTRSTAARCCPRRSPAPSSPSS